MTEEPKVSDFIEDKASLPEACADTVTAAKDASPVPGSALSEEEIQRLTNDLVAAIKTVYDPEIPVDIYELGLIYKIDVDDDRNIAIEMTLTAPGCPVAGGRLPTERCRKAASARPRPAMPTASRGSSRAGSCG